MPYCCLRIRIKVPNKVGRLDCCVVSHSALNIALGREFEPL